LERGRIFLEIGVGRGVSYGWGANLALHIHSLVTEGVLDQRVEALLLIASVMVTAAALILGVFILSNVFSSF
jgi:hypothetical protein